MALGKQAKTLSRGQIDGAPGYIAKTRYPLRNRVILQFISTQCGFVLLRTLMNSAKLASFAWNAASVSRSRTQ